MLVAPDLSLPNNPRVFAVGDLAGVMSKDGRPVPGVAPAANQMGQHAASGIMRDLRGQPRVPFAYFNKGDLATIGRHRAVAALGALKLQGYIAWLVWLFIHIMYLAGFRNRLSVFVQWAYSYFTYQRGVRLITGTTAHRLLKTSREREHERTVAASESATVRAGVV